MTTISQIDIKCPVCEKSFEISMMMSTNTWGAPDLDFRPAEMQRSTMSMWVHECPHCGYVEANFNDKCDIDCEFLKSDFYRTCDSTDFKNPLSEKFYRRYLIEAEDRKKFYMLLYCAWACDDKDDTQNAVKIRNMCIDILDRYELSEDLEIQKADLLRRSGQFERLTEEYSNKTYERDLFNQIIDFHIKKAKENDDACYTVDDVTKK